MKRLLLFCCLFTSLKFLVAQELATYEHRYFVEGLRAVYNGSKYGFVNRKYIHVIPAVYLDAKDFSEGLAAVKIKDSSGREAWVFIDTTGKQAINGSYEAVEYSFKAGLAAVRNEGKIFIINRDGEIVVEADEKWQLPFRHGLVKVLNDSSKYGVANLKGKLVIPIEFNDVSILSPTLVLVGKNKSYGLLDKEGRALSELEYTDAGFFNEGVLAVQQGNKWGFVNEHGKVVLPMQYDRADGFVDGKAWVSLNGEAFYIDKNGKRISNDGVRQLNPQNSFSKKNANQEFLNLLNDLVTACPYTDNLGFESLLDSPFVIQKGLLVGVFRTYAPGGPVLRKITVPVAKLQYVWYDYHFGFEFDENVVTIQSTLPGKKVFNKGETTNLLRLATPGDGHDGSFTEKFTVAIKALKSASQKKPVSRMP